MRISGLILRFFIAYLIAFAISTVIMGLLGKKALTTVHIAALLAAVVYGCMVFGQRNRRYLTRPEKWKVWVDILGIDIFFQGVFSVLKISTIPAGVGFAWTMAAFAFIVLLHAVVIYFAIYVAGSVLASQGIR